MIYPIQVILAPGYPIRNPENKPPAEQPKTLPQELMAYIVSDVHLNNHIYDPKKNAENPFRKHFRQFLTKLNDRHNDNGQKLQLILNGDILDIICSWFESVKPWDKNEKQVESALIKVIDQVVDNNADIFDELKRMLDFKNTEIDYVIGNHDNMFAFFPKAQEHLKQRITSDKAKQDRIHFTSVLKSTDLDLYATHGHQFDSLSQYDDINRHPFGEYVNILLINSLVGRTTQKLAANGYSPQLVHTVHQQLQDIEYLRPIPLIPLWIQSVAEQYECHPENKGKKEPIDQIIRSTLQEVFNPKEIQELLDQAKGPAFLFKTMLKLSVRYPKLFSHFATVGLKLNHNNPHKKQLKGAYEIHRREGYHHIVMGHTHEAEIIPLSAKAYYFNTGSWRPLIQLFKPHHDMKHPALTDLKPSTLKEAGLKELKELKKPTVCFNKIEHSGVLLFRKDLTKPESKTNFSLKTVETDFFEDDTP